MIYRGEILLGEICLKVPISDHELGINNIVIGNTYTFNIQNVSGSASVPRKCKTLLLCSKLSRIV